MLHILLEYTARENYLFISLAHARVFFQFSVTVYYSGIFFFQIRGRQNTLCCNTQNATERTGEIVNFKRENYLISDLGSANFVSLFCLFLHQFD